MFLVARGSPQPIVLRARFWIQVRKTNTLFNLLCIFSIYNGDLTFFIQFLSESRRRIMRNFFQLVVIVFMFNKRKRRLFLFARPETTRPANRVGLATTQIRQLCESNFPLGRYRSKKKKKSYPQRTVSTYRRVRMGSYFPVLR